MKTKNKLQFSELSSDEQEMIIQNRNRMKAQRSPNRIVKTATLKDNLFSATDEALDLIDSLYSCDTKETAKILEKVNKCVRITNKKGSKFVCTFDALGCQCWRDTLKEHNINNEDAQWAERYLTNIKKI